MILTLLQDSANDRYRIAFKQAQIAKLAAEIETLRPGCLSQREIARKFEVSTTFVRKIAQGGLTVVNIGTDLSS